VQFFFILSFADASRSLFARPAAMRGHVLRNGEEFHVLPLQGGYCAPPGDFCCPDSPNGLCLNNGTGCCPAAGCFNEATQDCCKSAVICGKGECCGVGVGTTCLTTQQQCCEGFDSSDPTDVYVCPLSTTCCTVLTSYSALYNCCSKDEVCCPNFNTPKEHRSSIVIPGQRSKKASVLRSSPNRTSCANPATDFCCAGVACPTETLCCAGNVEGDARSGCCFGFASKDFNCVNYAGNLVCPDQNTMPNAS
jgi:hypothetical protein